MIWFLVEYDRRNGEVDVTQFENAATAMSARIKLERAARPHVEIAVLASDSLESLRATHGRYFSSASQLLHSAAEGMGLRRAV